MKEAIQAIEQQLSTLTAKTAKEAEDLRISLLGKKGSITELLKEFKDVAPEEKKLYGQALNKLKNSALEKVNRLKDNLQGQASVKNQPKDLFLPSDVQRGTRHPISLVKEEITDIFKRLGFNVSEGPEIEDDWHNFSALNFPEEHPARDMQDTFFVDKDFALRTHTSSVQVRVMENEKPPIRTISPGRVFRNEAISSRSHCIFHQIEGLYIDKGVSFADLKQTLHFFAKEFFGKSKIRLRPSYFPFTEPSAEMDVYWGLETESDYRITKGTGWLEVLGCGMVDPNVLSNNNIDPEVYSGFAFGMGIERIAMLKYGISDIRHLFENDVKFLSQFPSI